MTKKRYKRYSPEFKREALMRATERWCANGWHEPYESRDSRTDLWGTGGVNPPVYPTSNIASFNYLRFENLPVLDFFKSKTPLKSTANF